MNRPPKLAALGFRQQDAELKDRLLQRRRNDERAAQCHQRTMRWLRMLLRALQLLHETAGASRPRPPPSLITHTMCRASARRPSLFFISACVSGYGRAI